MTTSLFDEATLRADYHKKIKQARESMAAFDELPPVLRDGLRNSKTDFSASQMQELLDGGCSIDRLLMALKRQQPPDR